LPAPSEATASEAKKAILRVRYLLGRRAGVPVVAGASSGIQVMASRSYLNPFAAFSASCGLSPIAASKRRDCEAPHAMNLRDGI
jgi:hypothetical protein